MTTPALTSTNDTYRFLIVDDSRAIQAIIRRVIERCGYAKVEFETANHGEAALEVLTRFSPHLIITDWHMPRMSGLELLQTLRQVGQTSVQVGLVTTETSETMLDEARRNGALFVINKPFKDDELISALTSAVPPDAPPPVPGSKPATSDKIVLADECQKLIQSQMNGIPFRLLEQEPLAATALTRQNLIGLYNGKAKPVSAIVVLDMNAVCILGGGGTRQPPAVVREAMQQGQASEGMVKQAGQFMLEAGALLRIASEAAPITLSRTSIVPHSFQKLQELLVRNGGRADFRISVPGYGDGRFSFLAV
jgi:CheY-like chemotaxis protein